MDKRFIQFCRLFDDVFDDALKIKPCGRQACIALILEAQKLDSHTDFGDVDTGFMNVDNILKLKFLGGTVADAQA